MGVLDPTQVFLLIQFTLICLNWFVPSAVLWEVFLILVGVIYYSGILTLDASTILMHWNVYFIVSAAIILLLAIGMCKVRSPFGYWYDQWAWWCGVIVLLLLWIVVGAYSYFTSQAWAVAFVVLASALILGIYLIVMHSWSYDSLYRYADKISRKKKRFDFDEYEKNCQNGFPSPIHTRRYGLEVIIIFIFAGPGQFIQFAFTDPNLGAIYTQYIILGAQAVSLVLLQAFISGIGWIHWCDYDLVKTMAMDYLRDEKNYEEGSEEEEEEEEEASESEEEKEETSKEKKAHKKKQKTSANEEEDDEDENATLIKKEHKKHKNKKTV